MSLFGAEQQKCQVKSLLIVINIDKLNRHIILNIYSTLLSFTKVKCFKLIFRYLLRYENRNVFVHLKHQSKKTTIKEEGKWKVQRDHVPQETKFVTSPVLSRPFEYFLPFNTFVQRSFSYKFLFRIQSIFREKHLDCWAAKKLTALLSAQN